MEQGEERILYTPTQRERLGKFTVSHFGISIVGIVGLLSSFLLGGYAVVILFLWEGVLLALYALAGVWMARRHKWDVPQRVWDGCKAFLIPTLVAWAWGGTFLLSTVPIISLRLGNFGDIVSTILFWSLLVLAFPSSWGFGMIFLFGGWEPRFWNTVPVMLLVGALPPALFLLGSILGSKKRRKQDVQT